jgi:hypothetical protein
MKITLIAFTALLMISLSGDMPDNAFAEDSNQYKTVNDILAGTPFKPISPDSYKKMVKHGKSVVFLYDNFRPNGVNGWVARLFKETANDFPDINFFSIKYDNKISFSKYTGLGFTAIPHYIFYVDGENVFSEEGGPANREEYLEFIDVMRRNLKELNDYE